MSSVAKSKPQLKDLHQESWFQEWISQVEKAMPEIPNYNPQDDKHNETSWAYWSGMREGYKLAISHLGVKI